MNKILIIGHARHGKDTVAEMISELTGYTFESSSVAASRIFLYDALKDKYGYQTPEECFEDRVNHRKEWHDMICEYNRKDKARLAKEILKDSDMYVGMRSGVEIAECKKQGVFNLVLGVFAPYKSLESKESFDVDFWKECDFVIHNEGSLEYLKEIVETFVRIYNLNGRK